MRYLSAVLLLIFCASCEDDESTLVNDSAPDTEIAPVAVKADTNWFDMDSVLQDATVVMEADVKSNNKMKAHSWFRNIRNDSVHCIEGDMDMTYNLDVNAHGDTIQCGHWPKPGLPVLVIAKHYNSRSTPRVSFFATRAGSYYRFWHPYHLLMKPSYFRISENVLPVPEFSDNIIEHDGKQYCPDGCLFPVSTVKTKE